MTRIIEPLRQRRTYLETADLLIDGFVGVVYVSVFVTLLATGVSLLFTLIGLPILTATLLLARGAADVERLRARIFLAADIEQPARRSSRGENLLRRLLSPFLDRTTLKELLYVALVLPVQSVFNFSIALVAWYVPVWAVTLPIYGTHAELWNGRLLTWHEIIPIAVGGLLILPLTPRVIHLVADADRAVARWGLSPSPLPAMAAPGDHLGLQRIDSTESRRPASRDLTRTRAGANGPANHITTTWGATTETH
jgi:hypothetical protein